MSTWRRSYAVYATGCAVVWAVIWIVLALVADRHTIHEFALVFGGWVIGWVSATIARSHYAPPRAR